tara:strand:+ start:454 stop:678 length:225 start_codon:yes stop_codon:yes gene_type:complete
MKKVWRIWAKALGDKSGNTDKEADFVAIIRTLIFVQLVITNCFIVAGNIRHWNDAEQLPDPVTLSNPKEIMNIC